MLSSLKVQQVPYKRYFIKPGLTGMGASDSYFPHWFLWWVADGTLTATGEKCKFRLSLKSCNCLESAALLTEKTVNGFDLGGLCSISFSQKCMWENSGEELKVIHESCSC